MDTVQYAMSVIEVAIKSHKSSCVLSSFGKDSLAMLYLFKKMGIKMPVVLFRYPYNQEKYEYAEMLARELKLELHQDVVPNGGSMVYGNDDCEIVHHFQIGNIPLKLPVGRQEKDNPMCGKEKFLFRNYGTYNWNWDLAFHGHKASDKDNLIGGLSIDCDIMSNAISVDYCYPIRTWTDDDVWQFLEDEKAIIHLERYEKIDGKWREKSDKTKNPDYFNYCVNCLNKNNPRTVSCPKTGLRTNNISSILPVTNLQTEFNYINGGQ